MMKMTANGKRDGRRGGYEASAPVAMARSAEVRPSPGDAASRGAIILTQRLRAYLGCRPRAASLLPCWSSHGGIVLYSKVSARDDGSGLGHRHLKMLRPFRRAIELLCHERVDRAAGCGGSASQVDSVSEVGRCARAGPPDTIVCVSL